MATMMVEDNDGDLLADASLLIGDSDLSGVPAVLRRPGPQPCNQIPPTYKEAMRLLHTGRPRWPHLLLWLRVARMLRRWVRLAVADALVRQQGGDE
jgi:hypothetical protein